VIEVKKGAKGQAHNNEPAGRWNFLNGGNGIIYNDMI
jgi:hypothetical protein